MKATKRHSNSVTLDSLDPDLILIFKNLKKRDLKVICTSDYRTIVQTARFVLDLTKAVGRALKGGPQVRIEFRKVKGNTKIN